MKRIFKRILLLLGVLLLLTSCEGRQTDIDITNTEDTYSEIITTKDLTKDSISAGTNLNGMSFMILTRTSVPWLNSFYDVTEMTGEIINDAVYIRNRSIESRLNVTIAQQAFDDVEQRAELSVLSGEDIYNMMSITDRDAYRLAQEGYMLPVSNLTYLDFEKTYWNKSIYDGVSVGDTHYLFCGSFNLTTYDYIHALAFNKNLWANYGLDNIYETVKDGNWTFYKFAEFSAAATLDLNGDGEMTQDDQYGFGSQPWMVLPNLWGGAGITTITKKADGIPYFNLPNNNYFVDVFERIFEITHDQGTMWMMDFNQFQTNTMFKNNQVLLYDINFGRIPMLRDIEVDFGIIPYPKYDEKQEDYISSFDGCKLNFVPIIHNNAENTSIVIEVMAGNSDEVFEAYYETSIRGKFIRDEESYDMLDIIFSNRVYDLGRSMWLVDMIEKTFGVMFENNNRNVASALESITPLINASISNAVEALQ